MKPAIILKLIAGLILLSSCKRDSGTVVGDQAGESVTGKIRASSPDQMGSGVTGLPQGPRQDSLRAVQELSEFFRRKDQAGLAEIERRFKEEQGTLLDDSGAEFMALLRKDEWQGGIDFVNGIQDEAVRFHLLASMMGRAITTDSKAALEILAGYKPTATEGLIVNDMAFNFQRMVWSSTGMQAGADWTKRSVDQSFLQAIASDKSALDPYAKGLGNSLGNALYSGEVFDVTKRMEGLPPTLQLDIVRSIASHGINSETDLGVVRQIIGLLNEGPDDGQAYRSMGIKVGRENFMALALESSGTLADKRLESFVSGWVSRRPKDSMEWLSSETTRPEILRPAFTAWIEEDSMEASNWLQAKPAGPARDLYTEQLCSYLLKKGSVKEAESYLATLPTEVRERLETKHQGQ